MLQWPREIKGGQVCAWPVSSLDILATAVAAAAGRLPTDRPVDGATLISYLTGKQDGVPHEFLAWRSGRNHAFRKGNWKILQYGDNPTKFVDLSVDVGEQKDLSRNFPEKVAELNQAYVEWESQMVSPLWQNKKPRSIEYNGERVTLDI